MRIKNLDEFNKLLIKRGFTKNRFSKLIGISSPMFIQITNGDRCPSPATAVKIADALGIEFDDLYVIEKRSRKQVG